MNIKKLRRLCSEIVEEDDPETRIAVAACRLASVGGIGLLVQNSGVNRSSALCYGLKIKIVAFHFDQHEIPISVETRFHLARKPQIVKSQLS